MPGVVMRGRAAVRRSGWRAFVLALASYVPLALSVALLGGALVIVGLVLQMVMLFALARCLGAWRPDGVPAPAEVGDDGTRVALPRTRPAPPVSDADRDVRVAARNAWKLWRPAVSVVGLYLLAVVAGYLTLVALSGGRVGEYAQSAQLLLALPTSAVFMAFVFLALQRVALEGDPRVLVAAAHSVRIARASYGWLLLLALVEPAVGSVGLLLLGYPDGSPSVLASTLVGVGSLALATMAKVGVAAAANELYLTGPRLDLPAELSRL